jgi:hypothetical protein
MIDWNSAWIGVSHSAIMLLVAAAVVTLFLGGRVLPRLGGRRGGADEGICQSGSDRGPVAKVLVDAGPRSVK